MCGENSFITLEASDSENCKIGHRNGIDLPFQSAVVTRLAMLLFVRAPFLLCLSPTLPSLCDIIIKRQTEAILRFRLNGRDFISMV